MGVNMALQDYTFEINDKSYQTNKTQKVNEKSF